MLDSKFIRQNKERVVKACRDKRFAVDIDELIQLDEEVRGRRQELEELQAERNRLSKQIPKSAPGERQGMVAQVKEIKEKMESLTGTVASLRESLEALQLRVPQPAADDVPVGADDSDNVELRTWGDKPQFDFTPRDHIELGESLRLFDVPRAVKISGSRSYVLTGYGALLEQAIMRFTYDSLLKRGFQPMSVPVLVTDHAMQGTGYFPMGKDQTYYVEKDEMALVGTAEVPLCSLHADEILPAECLPLRYMAWSSCFRREAGTYGKDTRGLYRVHQFQKIEMVVVAPQGEEVSAELHDELLGNAEFVVRSLEMPYRVVYVCSGDLGQGQVRKHDIETWMPSRQAYSETHSCSTFYDFQARRLNMRYRLPDGNKKLAYTLNNTACASPRILIPFLENHQTATGGIHIPPALRPYLGGIEELTPALAQAMTSVSG